MRTDPLGHEKSFRGDTTVNKRSKLGIVVMGVGSLGSWLTDLLVRQGYYKIKVVDMDRVEGKNYGTQNYGSKDLGKMKAIATANNIYMRLGNQVDHFDRKVTKDNVNKLIEGYDLVIDCFDNVESRLILKNACKAKNMACLHVGMSTDGFSEIEWNETYNVNENYKAPVLAENEPCDYPLASNLVHITVGLAAEIVNRYVDDNRKDIIHFTVKDLHVHSVKK